MSVITGTVTSVTTGKTGIKLTHGTFDELLITVTDNAGNSVTIEKLAKEGNNGQGFVGKAVQVTFTSKDVGGKTHHKTDSKGFIVLDQAPSTNPTAIFNTGTQTFTQPSKGSYNSDGARLGMLAKAGLDLAIAKAHLQGLKDISNSLLAESVTQMKAVVEALENPTTVSTTTTKPKAKTLPETSDDDSPF